MVSHKKSHSKNSVPQRKYFCKECGHYHLTHIKARYSDESVRAAWEGRFFEKQGKRKSRRYA